MSVGQVLAQRLDPAAGARADREDLARRRSSSAARPGPTSVCARSSRSTLLTATTTGTPAGARRPAMKRSPGPTPCSPLRTSSAASDSASSGSTRCCIRSVSASRGRWTPGRSTRTSCVSSRVATPRIARRVVWGLSETIATLRPTMRVDERRLADVRAPGQRDEARAGTARGYHVSISACSASISPSSVSWSMPGEVQRAVHDRLAQVGRVRRADHDVAQLARAGAPGRRRRPGRTARRSAPARRGARG